MAVRVCVCVWRQRPRRYDQIDVASAVEAKIHDFWTSKVRDNVQRVSSPQGPDENVDDAVVCVLTATAGATP